MHEDFGFLFRNLRAQTCVDTSKIQIDRKKRTK